MTSHGKLRHVALVTTNVLEERIASIIRVTRIGELGTTLALTNNQSKLRRNIIMEAIRSYEMSVVIRATWCYILGSGILHSHCRVNLECYIIT
jgi:folate-dependent phosphoribosylglycinamide formyltransferase PurN